MKKLQSFCCIALLSTTLVGNVFAGGVGTPTLGVVDSVINAVMMLLRDNGCPPRQCQNCRPGDIVDENGNCRPRED